MNSQFRHCCYEWDEEVIDEHCPEFEACLCPFFLVISAPHFVAGIEIGKRAAPIIAYMVRWSADSIVKYCARKGWAIQVLQ